MKWGKFLRWRGKYSILNGPGIAPEALQIVVGSGFFGKNIDYVFAVVHQNPFGVGIAFHARRNVAVLLQIFFNFVGDGLVLLGIRAAANDQGIGEGGHVAQVEHANIFCLFGFGGMDGGKPEPVGFLRYCLLE